MKPMNNSHHPSAYPTHTFRIIVKLCVPCKIRIYIFVALIYAELIIIIIVNVRSEGFFFVVVRVCFSCCYWLQLVCSHLWVHLILSQPPPHPFIQMNKSNTVRFPTKSISLPTEIDDVLLPWIVICIIWAISYVSFPSSHSSHPAGHRENTDFQ